MFKKNTPHLILFILVVVNLILGAMIAPDFGRTVDEVYVDGSAAASLRAYSPGSFGQYSDNEISNVDRFYGTAMTMLAQLAEQVFQPVFGAEDGVIVHYAYFVFFQIGIVSLFYLAKKFVDPWIALVTALLFASQPLYFGHAFINPKDIPLMAIFLAAVTTGIYMSDHLAAQLAGEGQTRPVSWTFDLRGAWRQTPRKEKRKLGLLQLVWPVLLALYLLLNKTLPALVENLFQAPVGSFLGDLLNRLVDQPASADVSAYINKALHQNQRVFQMACVVALLIVLFVLIRKIAGLRQYLADDWLKPVLNEFRLKRFARYLLDWRMLMAGFVWGWAISTRFVAIFAGLMVGLYLLLRINKRAAAPLFVYLLTAIVIAFLSFPQLWHDGFSKLIQGLTMFSSFHWNSQVLYQGQLYLAADLPRSYLPFFIGSQLTEPALVLAVIGLGVVLYRAVGKRGNRPLVLITTAWFVLPFLYILVTHPNLYNNCRQFLFITPPLFLFAGTGIDAVVKAVKSRFLVGLLAVVVFLPGILAIVQLHPYQYIYYNQFVGGVGGAFREYEIDYWDASSTEAIRYLNQVAPPNSTVVVWRSVANVEFSAREDLVILSQNDIGEDFNQYDYAIINTIFNADLLNLPDRETIYTIERNGAILSVVKALGENP